MISELVDLYDDEYRVIGAIERDKAHTTGALHKTMHCWYVDDRFVYFQIRSSNVGFPGLLDVTAGGHVGRGEDGMTALLREAKEEIGVELPSSGMHQIGRNQFTFRNEGTWVREFSEVYMLPALAGFDTFSPNSNELSGIAAIPFREGKEVVIGARHSLSVQALLVEQGVRKKEIRTITKESFVPSILDYFCKILEIGELFANGDRDISL